MKSIGAILLSSLLGLNIYNKATDTNIVVEYTYHPRAVKVVDVSPAPFITTNIVVSERVNQKPQGEKILKGKSDGRAASIIEYIEKHVKLAVECENTYGVPAELALAQAIIESGVANTVLKNIANNHHGFLQFDIKGAYVLYSVAPKYGTRKWKKFATVRDSYSAYGAKVSTDMKKLGVKVITIDEIVKTNYSGKKKGPDYDYARKVKNALRTYEIKDRVDEYKFDKLRTSDPNF